MFVAFSGAKGSGKTTAADYLVSDLGFQRVSMAGTLKRMMIALGCTEEQVYGTQKEVPNPILCGKTTRYAMQTIGTEWGRELIGSDIWVNAAEAEIAKIRSMGGDVVCDDIRFPNERAMLERIGGSMVLVRRKAVESSGDEHASERYWREMPYEFTIENEGNFADLFSAVVEVTSVIRYRSKHDVAHGA